MTQPDPNGWEVAITHPETGRVKRPSVLDSPTIVPSLNAPAEVRIPVPKSDEWLKPAYDDDPDMRAWLDGERQPVEVLRDVDREEDRTILVGVGGVELEARAQREWDGERRHLAARDLIQTETSYADDTPEPDVATIKDVEQQTVDSEAEWINALANANQDTDLWGITSDGFLRRRRTAYFAETDELTDARGTENFDGSGEYNFINGDILFFENPAIQNGVEAGVEYDFDLEYTIPGSEVRVAARMSFPEDQGDGTAFHPAYTQRVNGEELDPRPADIQTVQTPPEWDIFQPGSGLSDADPGSTTVEIKLTGDSSSADGEIGIDALMIYDARHPPTLINEVTQDSDRKAQVDFYNGSTLVETGDVTSAFSVVAGELTSSYNSTAGVGQEVGISNDSGQNWISATGSETVAGEFAGPAATIRARFGLGGFDGETQYAVGQVNGHEVDAYQLFADISQELLLIDETFDNNVSSILTDIAEQAERSWSFRYEGGTPTVAFVENGQRTSDGAPEFSERRIEKRGKTYESVTIKGSNQPVSSEPFTASETFVELVRPNILPGSETVYDTSGTNYERGDDYEMRYADGEIRATSGGDLVAGDAYEIDYRYQAKGTFTLPDAPAEPDQLVETVSGVTSQRLAEQVAFVIASEVETPRYAAEVLIPDADPGFDPLEAVSLASVSEGLGDIDTSPLEVRGSPQLTPRGLRVRFGTRPPIEEDIQRLARQVSRVSDRS